MTASPLALLAFALLAALTVFVCIQLVAGAATAAEPVDRHAGFMRVASGIACLVWALDATGIVLHTGVNVATARLWPAILGLCILLVSARFALPALANTRQRSSVLLAGAGLAAGGVASHLAVLLAFGVHLTPAMWPVLAIALMLGGVLLSVLALHLRKRRLLGAKTLRHLLSPVEIAIAGLFVLAYHLVLATLVPGELRVGTPGDTSALLVLGLFAALVCSEQLFSLRVEAMRQRLFSRALTRPHSFSPTPGSKEFARLAMIAERMEVLLDRRSIRMAFQPIMPVASSTAPLRFEALLRLHDNDLGYIDPELFFLACERTNTTERADRAVITHALQASTRWLGNPQECAGISVNVCHETLLQADFVDWMKQTLTAGSWPFGWLQLEITEHAMISHAEQLAGVLRRLRELGVGAVMDDFGAGFSSLGTLVDLPIQGIKCDRALVRALSGDPARQILLQHLCTLGRELGLSVTVEGVETQADLAIVREKGAANVQGYVFARPLAEEDVPQWMAEGTEMLVTAAA